MHKLDLHVFWDKMAIYRQQFQFVILVDSRNTIQFLRLKMKKFQGSITED